MSRTRALSAVYDRLYRRSPFSDSDRFYRWIVRKARPRVGEAVLDLGCGTGGALVALVRAGAVPWGLDLSSEALRQARARCPEGQLVLADGARLPFSEGSFRCLLNLGNLEHFADLEGGVREMHRVLTADGVAWILLPNLFYSGTLWRAIVRGYGPDHHQPIDRFATRNEWRDVLEAGGLRVVRSVPYHRGKWWKCCLPSNLAWHFLYETRKDEPSGRPYLPPLGRERTL